MWKKRLIYFLILAFSIFIVFIPIIWKFEEKIYFQAWIGDSISLAVFVILYGLTWLMYKYRNNNKYIRVIKWGIFILISFIIISVVLIIISSLINLNDDILFTLETIGSLMLFASLLLVTLFLIQYLVSCNKMNVLLIVPLFTLVLGLIFKIFHFPGASILCLSSIFWFSLAYMFIIHNKITEYNKATNRFLSFFRNFISISFIIGMWNFVFHLERLPTPGIKTISIVLLSISFLMLVFLLPSSNFINWTKQHKKQFYFAILIPMIFFILYYSTTYVFPEVVQKTFQKEIFKPYKIEHKIGLEKL